MENLTVVSINELNEENSLYAIPKIQRGYRWTNKQIKELIDDLENFFELKESYYCLQPLIVQRDKDEMSVIDGQQRLVTMYLISYYLFERSDRISQIDNGITEIKKYDAKIQYNIIYKNEGKTIYEMLNSDSKPITLTEKYIVDGYKYISKLLEDNKDKYKNIRKLDFNEIKQMLSKVKFIYYELEEKANEIEIFTNVNIGKLPLNTAEKIKGLMLKSDNFRIDVADENVRNSMLSELAANQEMIVEEWSEIEHKLQDNNFFYFFTRNYDQDIRINLLFELFASLNCTEEQKKNFDTFIVIENYLKQEQNLIYDVKSLRAFWNKIKELYYILLCWYMDDNLYHYVGYLIYFADDSYLSLIIELLKKYKESSKEDFYIFLHKKIKEDLKKSLTKPIEQLCYEDDDGKDKDKRTIKKILLLFNIENILQNFKYNNIDELLSAETKLNERFSFKRFKDSDYQLEHIHSQCDNIQDRVEWFETLYKYKDTLRDITNNNSRDKVQIRDNLLKVFEGMASTNEFDGKSEQIKTKSLNKILHDIYCPDSAIEKVLDNNDLMNGIIQGVVSLYTDDNIVNYKHNICNLTLLDAKTNAGYGNKIFPIKVLFIKNINTTTRFIPIATRNTMLKYYTDNPEHNLCWNKKDMDSYIKKIKLYLSYYLEDENND